MRIKNPGDGGKLVLLCEVKLRKVKLRKLELRIRGVDNTCSYGR